MCALPGCICRHSNVPALGAQPTQRGSGEDSGPLGDEEVTDISNNIGRKGAYGLPLLPDPQMFVSEQVWGASGGAWVSSAATSTKLAIEMKTIEPWV